MTINRNPTLDFFNGKQKKVTIDLDNSKSLTEAVALLSEYSNNLDMLAGLVVNELCKAGVEYAKSIVPVDTGELRDSITHEVDDIAKKSGFARGRITAGTDHAMFVEFGTGIRGKGTYPSDMGDSWVYDVFEQNCQGQPAAPFMYDTARYLERNTRKILGV